MKKSNYFLAPVKRQTKNTEYLSCVENKEINTDSLPSSNLAFHDSTKTMKTHIANMKLHLEVETEYSAV